MQIDPSKLFSRTNLFRFIAVAFALSAIAGGWHAAGKMSSPAGATPADALNGLLPMVFAVVSWIIGQASKVKPGLVQAVTAVLANPKDPVADFRLAVELTAYFRSQWPNSPAIATLDKFLAEFGPTVVADVVQNLPAPTPTVTPQG